MRRQRRLGAARARGSPLVRGDPRGGMILPGVGGRLAARGAIGTLRGAREACEVGECTMAALSGRASPGRA